MATPEGKVKTFIDSRMKRWFPEAVKYSPPGVGRYGKNGFPDRVWFIMANKDFCIPVCIEAKAEGGTLSPLQLNTLLKLKRQGCIVSVVVGKDENKLFSIRDKILKRIRLINELIGELTDD